MAEVGPTCSAPVIDQAQLAHESFEVTGRPPIPELVHLVERLLRIADRQLFRDHQRLAADREHVPQRR